MGAIETREQVASGTVLINEGESVLIEAAGVRFIFRHEEGYKPNFFDPETGAWEFHIEKGSTSVLYLKIGGERHILQAHKIEAPGTVGWMAYTLMKWL